ncbi:MAG: hypothetical protein PHI85_09090 [Victivallaceae bacterium]|nr:hypothetical protein [Victivallaceae bacterium]
MEYDYTMDEVMRVAVRAEQLALSMPAGFSTCPLATLRAVYNGIGPDRWSARLRRVVTELLEWFAPEALIHDWEYTFQPKTYWRFTVANLRFAWNACLAADRSSARFPWKLRRAGRGLLLAALCQLFGWSGYRDAKPPEVIK